MFYLESTLMKKLSWFKKRNLELRTRFWKKMCFLIQNFEGYCCLSIQSNYSSKNNSWKLTRILSSFKILIFFPQILIFSLKITKSLSKKQNFYFIIFRIVFETLFLCSKTFLNKYEWCNVKLSEITNSVITPLLFRLFHGNK